MYSGLAQARPELHSVDTTHAYRTMCHNRSVGCAVEFGYVIEESRFVTVEVESRSQTPSLRIDIDAVPTILTYLYHMHHYSYWGYYTN
jgi:hypothetical protein